MKKIIKSAAVLLAAVLLLCGCSAKSDSTGPAEGGKTDANGSGQSSETAFDEAAAKESLSGIWLLCSKSVKGASAVVTDPESTDQFLDISADANFSADLSAGEYAYSFNNIYISQNELLYDGFEGADWCAYLTGPELGSGESYTVALTDRNSLELVYINTSKSVSASQTVKMEFVKRSNIESWKSLYFAETADDLSDSFWVGSENSEELLLKSDGTVHHHLLLSDEETGDQYYYHDYYDAEWTLADGILTVACPNGSDTFTVSEDGALLTPGEDNQTCLSPLVRSLEAEKADLDTVLDTLSAEWTLCADIVDGEYRTADPEFNDVSLRIDYDGYGYSVVLADGADEQTFIPIVEEGPLYEGFLNEDWYVDLATEEVSQDSYSFALQPDGKLCMQYCGQADGIDFVSYMIFESR